MSIADITSAGIIPHRLLKAKRLDAVKIGSTTRITRASVERLASIVSDSALPPAGASGASRAQPPLPPRAVGPGGGTGGAAARRATPACR
jgi:hypothetical protein